MYVSRILLFMLLAILGSVLFGSCSTCERNHRGETTLDRLIAMLTNKKMNAMFLVGKRGKSEPIVQSVNFRQSSAGPSRAQLYAG
ncbi:hypothetical protein ACOME3_008198 [Neoechinorhynchus agilis]